jgi:histidinol-phosphate/aromatic aminotransferase/cobyric acid decarboxylase-like protein
MSAHGGDGRARALALGLDPGSVLDLSASLHPAPPPMRDLLVAAVGEVGRYPDASGATAALAEVLGVPADRVLLTNGGAEAIALLAVHLGRGWVEQPDFSLYARHLPVLDPSAGRWRSNPNNPLGELAAEHEQAGIWDEAFFPLATGRWTRGDEGAWRLGSLTKLWACPGLRLGYVVAPEGQDVQPLADRQPRWAVNGLALAVLEPMLQRTDLPAMHQQLVGLRSQLVELLRTHHLDVTPTEAPWVLIHESGSFCGRLGSTTERSRPQNGWLSEVLAEEGVFVRRCESFGLPGVLRVAVPDADGLERLHGALTRIRAVAP